MKIIDGRWVDQYNDPMDNFNVAELVEIGEKVEAIYGKQITYSRIDLISSIRNLTRKEENSLAYLMNRDDVSFSKLAGY